MKRRDRCQTVTEALDSCRTDEELVAFLEAMTWPTAMPATQDEVTRMAELRRTLSRRQKR